MPQLPDRVTYVWIKGFLYVPKEGTDALNMEPGGERGEAVKAALQAQSDRRSLQLHIPAPRPAATPIWTVRKTLIIINNNLTAAECSCES